MRDGIEIARRRRPVAALVTEQFWPQGDFVAASNGMPGVPRIRIPHPVAGSGHEAMRDLATQLAPRLLAVLRGTETGDQADPPQRTDEDAGGGAGEQPGRRADGNGARA